jgi:hypothetical protein
VPDSGIMVSLRLPLDTRLSCSAKLPAALCVAGLLCAYFAGGILGVGAAEREYEFSPLDPPHRQYLIPTLDTPFGIVSAPSSLVGRGVLAVARGRRGALTELAAVLAAVTAGLAVLTLSRLGLPILPSVLASL